MSSANQCNQFTGEHVWLWSSLNANDNVRIGQTCVCGCYEYQGPGKRLLHINKGILRNYRYFIIDNRKEKIEND